MELIYVRGMNCHLASLVSIANALGIRCVEAYAALWSETAFKDDTTYNIYTSRRVLQHLRAIGVMMDGTARERLPSFRDGELLLVGLDTFLIPWHPVFGHFHGPHYFFAQKESAGSLLCYDPIYGAEGEIMSLANVHAAAFELSRVYRVDANAPSHDLVQEARAVLRGHPGATQTWLAHMRRCKEGGKSGIAPVLKQISALLNNRYLYRQYVGDYATAQSLPDRFFDDCFLTEWEAIRAGLYKAQIVENNDTVLNEVSRLFADLMGKEIAMAKQIVAEALHRNGEAGCDQSP